MSISTALFTGISGLNTLGNSMSVVGDNIANVNTIGFKGSRATFEDVLSQSISTAAGTAQVGRGTTLSTVNILFQQGSFESTSEPTDLAIGGKGFFIVKQPGTESAYYTRAGQFRFDKDGNFINPAGYVVRGWKLDNEGQDVGAITDIVMDSFTSPPDNTGQVKIITNVDSRASDLSTVLTDSWDGTASVPISAATYNYQTSLQIYDDLGSSHDLTIYYDMGSTANTWEYMVTCNPDEDYRAGFCDPDIAERGILMRGEMTFNAANGTIESLIGETYDPVAADWQDTSTSTDGYHEFDAQFSEAGNTQTMTLNIGTRWNGTAWANDALSTTQYASSSTTIFQTQDGYATGFLQDVAVDTDGVITGHYSNGQILTLYRVALANFNNPWGLSKEGGNLFRATRISGDPTTGHPGSNGLGRLAPNALEQSNVDIATEFVKMISIERGFQANSRIITTTDNMLQELINLKR
ncbi:MAG: flagellar hook protein FlgE [Pseudomonadota bacterium]